MRRDVTASRSHDSMGPMFRRITPALAAVALVAGACGSGGDDSGEELPPPTPVPTIGGVGSLPDTVPDARSPIVRVPRPVNDDGSVAELPGEQVDGNRVLVIGDSIMASTAQRYGGQMCDELVPLGWAVQVEAEPSRFVEFGNRVLDRVFDPLAVLAGDDEDWDAAVVFLGSNYRGDQDAYAGELREILDTLAPRPTLLFTVTEYRPNWSEVNDVVWELGEEYDNVTVVDWEEVSKAPGVISSDRQHPTEAGRRVLAQVTAASLGAVGLGDGECLRSAFTDDSAINGGGSGSLGSPSTGSASSSGSSSGSGSSGSGSSGSGSTSSGAGSSDGDSSVGDGTDAGTTGDGTTGDGTTDGSGTADPGADGTTGGDSATTEDGSTDGGGTDDGTDGGTDEGTGGGTDGGTDGGADGGTDGDPATDTTAPPATQPPPTDPPVTASPTTSPPPTPAPAPATTTVTP